MNHGSRHTDAPDTAPDATPSADDAPISKTRRKQQMHALQALGERLVKLPAQQLARVPMPEDLAQAVHEARRTKSHEGLRRQMQYVGKLMRSVDASAIEQALAVDEERHQGAVHLMHRAERWRDGLLDGSLSLTDFIDEHPAAAQLGLPALLAQARREKTAGKPPRQQRQLYRLLHETLVEDWQSVAAPQAGTSPSDPGRDRTGTSSAPGRRAPDLPAAPALSRQPH